MAPHATRSRISNAAPAAAAPPGPVSAERVRQQRQTRFSPIRSLDPATLVTVLEAAEAGDIRRAALLWDAIERRDDVCRIAASKRKAAVARRPFEVLTTETSREARRQKAALEFFYNHVTARHAVERRRAGGFSALVRQAADAIGKGAALHHIRWIPAPEGVTAEFEFVPLWFFESKTGDYRFLESDYATDGRQLEDGEWFVVSTEGIMEAVSVAYMYKRLPLVDWLGYSEKFGFPAVHGKIAAAKGSAEWDDMVDALAAFANDMSILTSDGGEVNLIEAKGAGSLPFPGLVERMDRAIAALWRGADLSTLSAGQGAGQGASLQGDESLELTADDCALVTEALNTQVDRHVLKLALGVQGDALAYVRIVPPADSDTELDIRIDEFLRAGGLDQDPAEIGERYGRTVIPRPAPAAPEPLAPAPAAANSTAAAAADALGIPAAWLAPLDEWFARVEALASDAATPDDELLRLLGQAADQLPEIFERMDLGALAGVIADAMEGAALDAARDRLREISATPAVK